MKKTTYILRLIALIVLVSCNNFEKEFYKSIEQGQINAIKKGLDTFDLSTITNFEWDSVVLIRGDESVPIIKEEIEEVINNHISGINWEYRRSENIRDPKLILKTTDLQAFRDRFYFLTPDKKIIEKEIHKRRPSFSLENCLIDTINQRFWLSKEECRFLVKSNVRVKGKGTVFLFPDCKTELSPESIKILDFE